MTLSELQPNFAYNFTLLPTQSSFVYLLHVEHSAQLGERIKYRQRSKRKKKKGDGTSVVSKFNYKRIESLSTIKKAEDSSTLTHVNVKCSPFCDSLLDMTT